jgi:hypothetical protein
VALSIKCEKSNEFRAISSSVHRFATAVDGSDICDFVNESNSRNTSVRQWIELIRLCIHSSWHSILFTRSFENHLDGQETK